VNGDPVSNSNDMKNSTKKLLTLMDRCAKAVRFRDWGAMIDAARKNDDILAAFAALDADHPNLFKALAQGLRLGAGAPPPSSTQEQLEKMRAVFSQIPTETTAIAGALDRLSEQDRQELLKDVSNFIASEREAFQAAAQKLPQKLPGRRRISEDVRKAIVRDVDALYREKHFTKSDAVAEVSKNRELTERTIWSILKEQKADSEVVDAQTDLGPGQKETPNQVPPKSALKKATVHATNSAQKRTKP
jgi:hypothetical protein